MALISKYTGKELAPTEFESGEWQNAERAKIDRYWSGAEVGPGRVAEVSVLWTNNALHFRFDCRQDEVLIVSAEPRLDVKTIGLWERDVCEAFVAPGPQPPGPQAGTEDQVPGELSRYFEFEAAPTGEWLDLAIQQTAQGRVTDWDYRSGMSVISRVEVGRVLIAMWIPWEAFGRRPKKGERWRANFFRCVGAGPDRGYLAWQPTMTPVPNFHVPEKFGELVFGE